MTTTLSRALTAAALLMLGACVTPAMAQQRLGTVPGRGPINSVPAIRTDRQPGWVEFPQIRMGNWGVRSKAPRGIGKINGSLLPPPNSGEPSPRRAIADNGVQFPPSDGGFIRTNDGRYIPTAGLARDRAGNIAPGIEASVVASGDRWAIAAALRNSIDYSWLRNRSWRQWMINDCVSNCGVYSGWYHDGYYPSTFGVDPYYNPDPFVVSGNPPAPPEPAVDPEANLSVAERAALRLQEGKPDAAIAMLRSYADANPYDHGAARNLAVALLDARRTHEGVAVMALVYEQNPKLAWSPLPADVVGPERDLRDLVVRVVEYGHRTNSSSAWLTAAVLMQGEGRADTAFKMIERADGLGLNTEVSRIMRAALKP